MIKLCGFMIKLCGLKNQFLKILVSFAVQYPKVVVVLVVVLLFYVHGKHLRSCRDGQLT